MRIEPLGGATVDKFEKELINCHTCTINHSLSELSVLLLVLRLNSISSLVFLEYDDNNWANVNFSLQVGPRLIKLRKSNFMQKFL